MEERMDKTERRNKRDKGRKPHSRKSSSFWGIGGLIIGASLVVGLFFLVPRSEPWGLPAIPRNPRPATLPPELFTGQVARVYRIAREVPELLERMPCYCGCYVNPGHRNNLDCYTDRYGAG